MSACTLSAMPGVVAVDRDRHRVGALLLEVDRDAGEQPADRVGARRDGVRRRRPLPTVTCASAAAVSVRNPPTLSLNADASMFSPLFAPAVFDVSCRRYVLSPTCTAVAVTPAPAALMLPTTVARLPSPVLTLLPLTVPVVSPPDERRGDRPRGGVQRDALARRRGSRRSGSRRRRPAARRRCPRARRRRSTATSAPSASPPVTCSVACVPWRVVASASVPAPVSEARDRRARGRRRVLHRLRELARGVGAVRERERRRRAVDARAAACRSCRR